MNDRYHHILFFRIDICRAFIRFVSVYTIYKHCDVTYFMTRRRDVHSQEPVSPPCYVIFWRNSEFLRRNVFWVARYVVDQISYFVSKCRNLENKGPTYVEHNISSNIYPFSDRQHAKWALSPGTNTSCHQQLQC